MKEKEWKPPLKIHEFFSEYANLPIGNRMIPLDFGRLGLTTMQDIYKAIHDLEDEMLPKRIKVTELLATATEYIDLLKSPTHPH
jgi:hypothetical protein